MGLYCRRAYGRRRSVNHRIDQHQLKPGAEPEAGGGNQVYPVQNVTKEKSNPADPYIRVSTPSGRHRRPAPPTSGGPAPDVQHPAPGAGC